MAVARRRWRRRQRKLNPKRLVFVDETALNLGMTRRGGRCPRGERLVCKTPFAAWKTVTMVAALRHDRLTAPMLLEGAMTAEIFRAYIEKVLGPTLRRGDIVVMDNVPLHKTRRVRDALETFGVTVPEFPAYSPDFNAIEQPIGTLKSHLRKFGARTMRALNAAVRIGLKRFTPDECAAYVRHAGYGQRKRKLV